MELKLSDKKTIKISKGEYYNVLKGLEVRSFFNIKDAIKFEIQLGMSEDNSSGVKLQIEATNFILVKLSTGDLEKLMSDEFRKNGVTVDDFTIQVDYREKKGVNY